MALAIKYWRKKRQNSTSTWWKSYAAKFSPLIGNTNDTPRGVFEFIRKASSERTMSDIALKYLKMQKTKRKLNFNEEPSDINKINTEEATSYVFSSTATRHSKAIFHPSSTSTPSTTMMMSTNGDNMVVEQINPMENNDHKPCNEEPYILDYIDLTVGEHNEENYDRFSSADAEVDLETDMEQDQRRSEYIYEENGEEGQLIVQTSPPPTSSSIVYVYDDANRTENLLNNNISVSYSLQNEFLHSNNTVEMPSINDSQENGNNLHKPSSSSFSYINYGPSSQADEQPLPHSFSPPRVNDGNIFMQPTFQLHPNFFVLQQPNPNYQMPYIPYSFMAPPSVGNTNVHEPPPYWGPYLPEFYPNY